MSTNPLDRIQSYYDELTNKDKDIAVYIINNPLETARTSIDTVAKAAGTSKSALVRFSNRIGYSGFSEFKYDLSRFLVSKNSGPEEEGGNSIQSICNTYSEYIRKIAETVNEEDLERIAEILIGSRHTKIFGFNRTFNSVMQLRQRLSKIGLDAEAVNDLALMTNICETVSSQDCVIIFTVTDNYSRYKEMVMACSENKCPVICFTMTQALSFKKYCDRYIVLPRISRDSSISFLDDQAIFMVLIELVMNAAAVKLNK